MGDGRGKTGGAGWWGIGPPCWTEGYCPTPATFPAFHVYFELVGGDMAKRDDVHACFKGVWSEEGV